MRSCILLCVIFALGGCVQDSPGRFRDESLGDDAPLVRFMLECQERGANEASQREPVLEAEAMQQLEDLVEVAASRVAREKIDYPSAQLGDFDFIVEVDRRGTPDYEEWFYSAFYADDIGYGAKYVFDHAGIEKGYDAIDAADTAELAELIDSYVLGDSVLATTEPKVRELETRIRKELGISEADWFENERRYDSAIDWLGGFTEPASSWPFSHCRIEIPRGMLAGTLEELLTTYGHELLHCRIGDFHSETEEQRMIEETSCEIFGARVVAELQHDGRLPPAVLARVDAGTTAAPDSGAAREPGERAPQTPSASPSDEGLESDDVAAIEAEFSRLVLLYRHPDVQFASWQKTQARYGREEGTSRPHSNAPEEIATLMDRMALSDYVALIPSLTRLSDLSRVCAEARRAGHVSLAQARRILNERH